MEAPFFIEFEFSFQEGDWNIVKLVTTCGYSASNGGIEACWLRYREIVWKVVGSPAR